MPITQSDDYPETEEMPSPETAQDAGPDTTDAESEDESTTSALLPKSLVSEGVKVGDTITLKVEAIMEDEVQVCTVGEDSEEEDSGMKESMSKLDSMAMEGE